MESTNSPNDQQTPPTIPINNSSSRRKQSKPNRLEHVVIDNPTNIVGTSDSSILPSITQYHVAAEQQDIGNGEDEYDQISLNCEDGSLSSQSTTDDNLKQSTDQNILNNKETTTTTAGVLDFSLKLNDTNKSSNRSRSLNSSNKSRSLKRKHPNENNDQGTTTTTTIPTRIFHADAFCGICRKEFCNKYFLKTHLANKHGIFDHPSTSSIDTTNDSNIPHPFTVISTLTNDDQEDFSSPSSDTPNHHDENETELGSLQRQMNGVIPDDDDNTNTINDNSNDDEQDGSISTSLMNLPQQIATILGNENNNLKTDEDQRVMTTNSPLNNLEFSSRQSSTKLLEDFCDICQKHFCNKYYLRKHKLDVHGVQTDCNIKPYKRIDSAKTSSPPAIQLSSSFTNVTFNPSSVQQSLGMLLNPIFSPLVQSSNVNEQQQQQTLSTNKRRYTDSSNESSSSKTTPQFLSSDVVNVFANQLVAANNTSIITKSQISTCHLCGKKFQSNDYLQLHLMNKHQIKTDQSTLRTTKLSNLIKISNNDSTNTIKRIKLEPNEISVNVIKALSPMDTITSTNTTTTTIGPGIVDTYFAAKMADRVSCDICHKQVCNKYFLKTHKLKVHGVGPDPLVSSSNPASINNKSLEEENDLQQSNDSSPPRLIVDDIISEPGAIPSPDALTASVNTFIGTNCESNEQLSLIICDLCSKTFPSKFLLHIHMTNVHGISQPTSISNGTSSTTTTTLTTTTTTANNKNPIVNSGIKRPLTNGNNPVRLKQTPQVQLRVTCQVCKKELCNKYFLRAHMRNVHNISVDDIRLIQPQQSPNSDKQQQQHFSLSSNLLSPTSTIPTDTNSNSLKHSFSHDNELNNFNGHITDSNESENVSSSNDNNNNHNQLLSMQPFLVESDDDLYKDLFVPCMVYLPCRHRVTKPLEVSLRLKPVDNTSITNTD